MPLTSVFDRAASKESKDPDEIPFESVLQSSEANIQARLRELELDMLLLV